MIQIVYVISPESQKIYVWQLNTQREKLKLIQTVFTPGQAQPVAVHPTNKFLYIGVRPDFKIVTYSIDRLGFLKNIGNTKIFSSPTYLLSNVQGTFLYCVSYQYNTVTVLPINMLGVIQSPVQIIKGLLGCHSIGIDKYKKLLWIPCLKENSIRLFQTNTFGNLTKFNPDFIKSSVFSGPRHIIFHKMNCSGYVINELNSTVSVIHCDAYFDKKIPNSIIQTLNIIPDCFHHTAQFWGSDIHITANGRWLYCSDRAASIISCFEVSYDSKLLKFMNYQLTETQPRGFAIDFTGKFLIVAGQKSHHISLYRINQNNGELIFLSRYHSGQGPMWVSFVALS